MNATRSGIMHWRHPGDTQEYPQTFWTFWKLAKQHEHYQNNENMPSIHCQLWKQPAYTNIKGAPTNKSETVEIPQEPHDHQAYSELEKDLEPQGSTEDQQRSLRIIMALLVPPWHFQYYLCPHGHKEKKEGPSGNNQDPEFTQEYEGTHKNTMGTLRILKWL